MRSITLLAGLAKEQSAESGRGSCSLQQSSLHLGHAILLGTQQLKKIPLPSRLLRVMCGRRLIDKSFFTLMQHWSGAVMCPAC
jgi:hypothetical protein